MELLNYRRGIRPSDPFIHYELVDNKMVLAVVLKNGKIQEYASPSPEFKAKIDAIIARLLEEKNAQRIAQVAEMDKEGKKRRDSIAAKAEAILAAHETKTAVPETPAIADIGRRIDAMKAKQ